MRIIPLAVLSLILAVATTEGFEEPSEAPDLSEYPFSSAPSSETPSEAPVTETPSETPVMSEYPFSIEPFFTTATLYPDAANCKEYPKDTHSYILWKLQKTYGEENCEYGDGFGFVYDCAVRVEGWFQSSAKYTYVFTEQEDFRSPRGDGEDLELDKPFSLEITDTNLSGGSFWRSIDFVEECMRDVVRFLNEIEKKRETKPEDFPSLSPRLASLQPANFVSEDSDDPFTDEPTSNLFDCPDTHREIVAKLSDIFGEGNCRVNNQGFDNTMTCTGEVPNWWRGEVTYGFHGSKNADDTSETPDDFDPGYLTIIDTYKYGNSLANYVDFNDSGGVDGKCLDDTEIKSQLNVIDSRLKDPTLAPNCENKSGDFRVSKKKTLNCDDISRLGLSARRRKCEREAIAENCPGLCNKQECPCTDLSVPFLDKNWTCEQLSQLNSKKLTKKCSKNKFSEACPTVCLGQNFGDACYANYSPTLSPTSSPTSSPTLAPTTPIPTLAPSTPSPTPGPTKFGIWETGRPTTPLSPLNVAECKSRPLMSDSNFKKIVNDCYAPPSVFGVEGCDYFMPFNCYNTSQITDMSYLFSQLFDRRIFNLNIDSWDTSSVTNMQSMFQGARSFNQRIGNWDVSRVTNMDSMFEGAKTFYRTIQKWNVSSVTNMDSMFDGARAFNAPIEGWETSSVISMEKMFSNTREFNRDIGNWDVSKVENMGKMFERAKGFNQPIGNWDVSSVTQFSSMFDNALSFDQNIGSWDCASDRFGFCSDTPI